LYSADLGKTTPTRRATPGGGDHARCAASFLTGAHPHKTSGKDIRVGVSVDQIAAQQVGELTRLPSLELGCEVGKDVGNCDSGYSCAYSNNISWRTESTPQSKEVNPRAVFDRLFGGGKPGESEAARLKRQEYRKSVLDFVHEDATRLRTRLGTADRHKLDEYLDSVRSIEQRIERTPGDGPDEQVPLERPDGIPRDYAEHIRLMMDLIAVAFQTDSTRITSMMIAKAGSNRSYPFIGVSGAHHSLSHHGNKKEKQEDIAKINKFHVEQFAYLLKRLKATPEGEGTLLDNVMLVYGSAIADGNRHAHHDLPIVMAGGGGGTINTGRHIRYESKTPLNNLFLSMLDRMDVKIDQMGDSTGRLDKLA